MKKKRLDTRRRISPFTRAPIVRLKEWHESANDGYLYDQNVPRVSTGRVDTWGEVRDARKRIGHGSYPEYRRLERCWRALERAGLAAPEARDYKQFPEQPPLAYAMFCVEHGYYPPPEVMIGLAEQWGQYIHGSFADRRLESAFLGPPARKGGDFKARWEAGHRRASIAFDVHQLRALHRCSFEAAAQLFLNRSKLNMTVETVLKYTHRNSPIAAKRKNKGK